MVEAQKMTAVFSPCLHVVNSFLVVIHLFTSNSSNKNLQFPWFNHFLSFYCFYILEFNVNHQFCIDNWVILGSGNILPYNYSYMCFNYLLSTYNIVLLFSFLIRQHLKMFFLLRQLLLKIICNR